MQQEQLMNDRIRILAEEAATYAYDNCIRAQHPLDWEDIFTRKFSELIVQECCKVIDNHYEPVYDGKILKEHFGVEI